MIDGLTRIVVRCLLRLGGWKQINTHYSLGTFTLNYIRGDEALHISLGEADMMFPEAEK